jgi:diguanylate cyclase (GGDEF)-like protein
MRHAPGSLPRFAALLSAAIASAASLHALASPFFSELGTRDGLPDASVSAMAQDGQGFIWFGTQGGLARYDGRSFRLFRHDPFDDDSLPNDQVEAVYPDGDLLWAGTRGGLARLDLKTERFVAYFEDDSRRDSLSDDEVTCVARDSRGGLWAGTMSGLDLLDEATGRFTRFRHDSADPASLPADEVRALKTDRQGRLWIGTSGGLALFDYATKSFRRYRNAMSDCVTALDLDPTGRLWVGTWRGGLSLFDSSAGRFENHPIADGRVTSVFAGGEGPVYAGTAGGGLFAYDLASGVFMRYRAALSPGSLSSDLVSCAMEDGSGLLWIGTDGGGVCRMDGTGGGLEIIAAGPDSFPPGRVSSVLVDRRGSLWVGVYGEGLARRDPSTGAWRRYRNLPGDPRSLPGDVVNFLLEDSRGEVWAGTDGGLARYDRGGDSFSAFRPLPGGDESPSAREVLAMAADPAGGAWIGTFRSGLYRWDEGRGGGSGTLARYGGGSQGAPLSGEVVNALSYDDSGRLWIGTERGLARLEDGAIVRRPSDSTAPIRTMFLDSHRVLWIGSDGGGLMRYEPATDTFMTYTTRDGLPSDSVRRILEDSSGKLWIATQTGLAVYDRAYGRFRPLHVRDERRSYELFSGAFEAPDGSLYFGALDRLYRFDPARYAFNGRRPPVVISSIAVAGRPAIGAAAALRLGRLDLPWRENSVVFDFAVLDFRDPDRNRFSYRLEGYDAEWSPAGPGHSAAYARLPGGDYTFRVKASNGDGLWNEEGLALPLRVGYAPWKSPWTLAAFAVLLAGGGFAFLSSRSSLRAAQAETDVLLSKLVDATAFMENAAVVDPLTGLPNPRKAAEHLELAFERAVRMKLDLAVLAVDIDHFKAFNDRCGKAAGDECLRSVADALSGVARRSSDFVARYGGEEFIFVLEETGLEGALAKGEEARSAVEALDIPVSGAGLQGPAVTVSVGCASVQPEAGQTPAYLLAAAEKALVAAKQRGRNRSSA